MLQKYSISMVLRSQSSDQEQFLSVKANRFYQKN